MDHDEAEELERIIFEQTHWEAVIDPAVGDGWVLVVIDPHTNEPQITLHNREDFEAWAIDQGYSSAAV